MKKSILFVIDSLSTGGAEKSLVTLLSMLDYGKYEVDLQLFASGGKNEIFVPHEVHVFPMLPFFNYSQKPITAVAKDALCFKRDAFSRLGYSMSLRHKGLTHVDRACAFWRNCKKSFGISSKKYDVAIAYGQGIPSFYVADCVNADKKFAWINAFLVASQKSYDMINDCYNKLDNIVVVSEDALCYTQKIFPNQPVDKFRVILDPINAEFIGKLADCDFITPIKTDKPIVLTVARLNSNHKGYDIAIEACKLLHDRRANFRWYAIGEGPYRESIANFVRENGLEDTFIMLGSMPNPYPYIKTCTIYAQTSRKEGFGLSIAEARLLNRPVVTTEYDGVYVQMVPDKNGIVTKIDAVSVADAIEDLLNNPGKREAISNYQRSEKKGNPEELQKFYSLIER
jgi:glycosyltransferase involved in cell wall biosynthesis